MLEVEKLSFKYKKKEVLREINLQVRPGELLSIAGPNGSGKTTLLRCLLNILRPFKGRIMADGLELDRLSPLQRARQLSYVPQDSPFKFPVTVFDMVLMGRRPYLGWRPSEKDLRKVSEMLELMAIEHLCMQEFDRLSGGQQQKVLLARAFVQEAGYILLDEPTSSLDLRHQLETMDLLQQMVREKGTGTVVAIHDLNLARRYSDQVVFMDQGSIFSFGSPDEVMTPETIGRVYGVRVRYISNNGHKYLVPVETLKT
ncbi:MAG: ABC transporter ATP-binding protein [Thermodesulfobacteriota bacterium]